MLLYIYIYYYTLLILKKTGESQFLRFFTSISVYNLYLQSQSTSMWCNAQKALLVRTVRIELRVRSSLDAISKNQTQKITIFASLLTKNSRSTENLMRFKTVVHHTMLILILKVYFIYKRSISHMKSISKDLRLYLCVQKLDKYNCVQTQPIYIKCRNCLCLQKCLIFQI